MDQEILKSICSNNFFKGVDVNFIIDSQISCNLIFLKEGDYLYREGDSSDSLYLIVYGEINVNKSGSSYSKNYTNNEFIGHEEIIISESRKGSAISLRESFLIEFFKDEVKKLMSSNKEIFRNLKNSISVVDSELWSQLEAIIKANKTEIKGSDVQQEVQSKQPEEKEFEQAPDFKAENKDDPSLTDEFDRISEAVLELKEKELLRKKDDEEKDELIRNQKFKIAELLAFQTDFERVKKQQEESINSLETELETLKKSYEDLVIATSGNTQTIEKQKALIAEMENSLTKYKSEDKLKGEIIERLSLKISEMKTHESKLVNEYDEKLKSLHVLEEKVKEIDSENLDLKSQNTFKDEYLEEISSEVALLKQEVESLNSKNETGRIEIENLYGTNKELEDKTKRLELELSDNKIQIAQLTDRAETAEQSKKDFESVKSELSIQLENKKEELNNLEKELRTRKDIHDELVDELETTNENLDAAETELSNYKMEVDEKSAQIDKLRDENEVQKNRVNALENDITQMQNAVFQKDSELIALRNDSDDLSARINELNEKIEDKDEKIKELERNIEDTINEKLNLERIVEELNNLSNTNTGEINFLDEIESLKRKNEKLLVNNNALLEKSIKSEEIIGSQIERLQAFEEIQYKYEKLKKEKVDEEDNSNLPTGLNSNDDADQIIEDLVNKNSILASEVSQLKEQIENLNINKNELESFVDKPDEGNDENEEILKLREEVLEQRDEFFSLKQKIGELNKSVSSKENENDLSIAVIENLKLEIAELKEQLDKEPANLEEDEKDDQIQEEIKSKDEKISELEYSIEELKMELSLKTGVIEEQREEITEKNSELIESKVGFSILNDLENSEIETPEELIEEPETDPEFSIPADLENNESENSDEVTEEPETDPEFSINNTEVVDNIDDNKENNNTNDNNRELKADDFFKYEEIELHDSRVIEFDLNKSRDMIVENQNINETDVSKNYQLEYRGNIAVINVFVQRATLTVAKEFKEFLFESIKDGNSKIIVDLSRCEFIDSTFLGVLVSGLKDVTRAGGGLRLVLESDIPLGILHVTRMDKIFKITSSVEEALDDFH